MTPLILDLLILLNYDDPHHIIILFCVLQQMMSNLRVLEISDSSITIDPDFSGGLMLETIVLEFCMDLQMIN